MRVQYLPATPIGGLGYALTATVRLNTLIDRNHVDLEFDTFVLAGVAVDSLVGVDFEDPVAVVSRAWRNYDLSRPAIYALGDADWHGNGSERPFLASHFAKMLRLAEEDIRAEARRELERTMSAAAARLRSAVERSMVDLISRMTPEQREARARSIINEIELLQYKSFAIRISERRRALEAELALLNAAPEPSPVVRAPAIVALVAALIPEGAI